MMDEEQAKALLNCMLRIRYLEKEMANLQGVIEKQREVLKIHHECLMWGVDQHPYSQTDLFKITKEALALTAKEES